MKKLGKKLGKVIALALALTLAAVFFPYARDWAASMLPRGKYERAVSLITHEMEKTGELTAVKYTDQGIMESATKALLLGEVQKVKVPYAYEIGLGIDLRDVTVSPGESGLEVTVPKAKLLYDSFRVTGEAEVSDFLYPLSEKQYQQMLDDQAADCRMGYMNDPEKLAAAWEEACAALQNLIGQWTETNIPLTFLSPEEGDESNR